MKHTLRAQLIAHLRLLGLLMLPFQLGFPAPARAQYFGYTSGEIAYWGGHFYAPEIEGVTYGSDPKTYSNSVFADNGLLVAAARSSPGGVGVFAHGSQGNLHLAGMFAYAESRMYERIQVPSTGTISMRFPFYGTGSVYGPGGIAYLPIARAEGDLRLTNPRTERSSQFISGIQWVWQTQTWEYLERLGPPLAVEAGDILTIELRAVAQGVIESNNDFNYFNVDYWHTFHAYLDHSTRAPLITRSGHNYSSPLPLSGTIALQEAVNNAQTLTFTFRPAGGYAILFPEVFTREVTLNPDGSFNLETVPPGTYEVSVKGAKWLRKNVMLDNTTGPVTTFALYLLAGDANDDNSIDVFDLDLLIQSFDSAEGDAHWNSGAADFNCDGSVDVFDLDLLIRNFDRIGDV